MRATIGALMPQIERLHQLYEMLAKARAKRGAIEFETSEVRFVLDAAGRGHPGRHARSATTRTS